MDSSVILVLAVLGFLIVFLYKEYLRPTVTFALAILVLVIGGVISPAEALHGFANEQLAVIVLLLILSNTLGRTPFMEKLLAGFFKRSDTPKRFFSKMLASVGVSSALLNNTPLVALTMPVVYKWTQEKKEPISHYLIPLSFISILGGCVTLIGTSTNLIANGLAIEYGAPSLGIFDFAYVGIPMLFIGGAYLIFIGPRLLKDKEGIATDEGQREYCVETIIKEGSPLIGKTVEEAGLRNLKGLFLVQIIKKNRIVRPAPPDARLDLKDKLIFVGDTKSIAELSRPKIGLSLPNRSRMPITEMESVIEVVVSPNSSLIGNSLRDTDFRSLYNGAIMAIHRNGEQLEGKLGEVSLQAGDMLLILAGRDFMNRIRNTTDFFLVSQVQELSNTRRSRAVLLLMGLIAAILLAVFDLVPLFTSVAVLVLITIVTGIQKIGDLRSKVDFDLILIIAMGLALGKAMINSGVAEAFANRLTDSLAPLGIYGLLAGFFLVTNLLTAFMTSKAAVAILIPVALSAAAGAGLDPAPFILMVAYGGAASFITPIGYQTNLMVYGPGGYDFKDYFRIGFPLTLIYGAVATVVLVKVYGLG